MSTGWIKLHRSLSEWEWYDDINARILLIHLLISVNYEDKKWKGLMVKKGSMVLSWSTLSKGCGLSIKQCRTAMQKLEESGEVARNTASRFQVVNLVKWDKLQQSEDQEGKQTGSETAGKRQAEGRQGATTKEDNNIKNIRIKEKGGRFTPPSQIEVYEFMIEKKVGESRAKIESQKFIDFYESKNWLVGKTKMAKWKSAVSGWITRMEKFTSIKPKTFSTNR
ncbi:hypothetical protein [Leeuwenhoekiella sp. MAR_2009_132]|uniref:hypothetical protein n=1 Tax=Leeuwenhoekiella sp. MAR_2009_132 TaxID=1392489 RepID=UPI00048F14DC|nr:hypothetical protein [Leeuwenhoekiella sp. MAR_2009_132]